MRGLVLCSPAFSLSTLPGAALTSKHVRGLDNILGDLGQAVGDLAGGALDAAGAALDDVGSIVGGLIGTHPATVPSSGGNGAPSGHSTSASGGGLPSDRWPPRPTYTSPASGGDASPPAIPQGAPPPFPPPPLAWPGGGTPAAPPQTASGWTGAIPAPDPITASGPAGAPQRLMQSSMLGGAKDGHPWTDSGAPPTASATPGSPSGTLDDAGGGHRHTFPPGAVAAIATVFGLLVLAAILCAVWFYRRKRRRAARANPYPRRAMSLISDSTVSTVPLFVSGESPFRHPRDADADEDDPFHARVSWWSASTERSASPSSV